METTGSFVKPNDLADDAPVCRLPGLSHAGVRAHFLLRKGKPGRLPADLHDMPESWSSRLTRWRLNWFPAYRATGARITYISADRSEVRIRLPLNRRTRNYVGTIFGGSMYAAVDPVYMVMLIEVLGPEYVVWDKAATIRFLRPGRQELYASFRLTPDDVAAIRSEVDATGRTERQFTVELQDAAGDVHAVAEKVVSIRRRRSRARVTGT